jgi:hypothetical protein
MKNTELTELARNQKLFALIDPFFQVPFEVQKQNLDIKDTDTELFEMIAWDKVFYQPPQLIEVNPEVLRWLNDSLATERWGIFIVASVTISQLSTHLQKFVITKGPEGSPYFLRFHDAAVLETLLGVWTAHERNMFFGPIQSIGLPNLDDLQVKFVDAEKSSAANLISVQNPENCVLHLSEEQLKMCREAIENDLIKLIYWHLRSYHSKVVQYIDKSVLMGRIAHGLIRARHYQLATISDLAGFVALMFELAPNFDHHPSFAAVLSDANLLPEQKMRRLSQVITDREWQEALKLHSQDVWPQFKKRTA